MKFSRPSRLVAVLVALFSILFMQFAVAAYACPTYEGAPAQTESFSAVGGQDMPGCHTVDAEEPNLCKADSQKNQLSLDKPAAPVIPGFAPSALLAYVVPSSPTVPNSLVLLSADMRSRSAAPAVAIRNCCFRI